MRRDRAKKPQEPRDLGRREVLGLLGATTAAMLFGCERGRAGSSESTGAAATTPACVMRPEQTEGPYFIDETLNRSDIRTDPAGGPVKEGVSLGLAFHVSRIDGGVCAPLAGAVVDVWQCDALGIYSGVQDINGFFDTRGEKFLRGYQVTDAAGGARFVTIYPGWYPGRTVHIHFKIRSDPAAERGHEFTSQFYFDDALTDQVYTRVPYAAKGMRAVTNDEDRIFQNGGRRLMLRPIESGKGYVGTFDIGLRMT